MCGIVAVYGDCKRGRKHAEKMVNIIHHRGPDEQGFFCIGDVVLGHARLSIIDLKTGKQPILNESGNLAITFNGEIYNFQELKELLKGRHRFKTGTDTEVILHLYEDYGEDLFPMLDGMFALVIASPRGFVAVRDPLGIKPLYTGKKDGLFFVSSEMKAFPFPMDGIESLPAGHFMVSGERPVKYADPLKASKNVFEPEVEKIKADIKYLVEKAVIKRLVADVPVGVYLSGGLDSSLVASIMKKHVKNLHSFTAGMEGSPDIVKAREVAKYLGTRHHEMTYTKKNMKNILKKVIYHLESFDAPLIRSALPMYFVSELAAKHVKVILSGEGADELFSGYSYLKQFKGPKLRKALDSAIFSLQDTNLQRADRISMAHSLEARVPFLDYQLVRYSLRIPPKYFESGNGRQEKWLLRETFEGFLPPSILSRPKMKFSVGAGSADEIFLECANSIKDGDFQNNRKLSDKTMLRSKEEYYYYKIFQGLFGERLPPALIGRTVDKSAGTGSENAK